MIDRLTLHNYVQRMLTPVAVVGGAVACGYLATHKFSLLLLLFTMVLSAFLILKGRKDIAFGLIITLVIMNNFYDLIPNQIFSNNMLNKLSDFGFIYLGIVTTTFIPHVFLRRNRNIPAFVKCFYLFLSIVVGSFIISLASLPYPIIDTFRAFRAYLGYLLLPLLIVIFDKDSSPNLSIIFNKLLRYISYISFILLILYNLQFLMQHQFFFGYGSVYRSSIHTYIRSLPNFLLFSYFFFWLFLAQWLSGKRLSYWKLIYIGLSCSATLFTFTRGLYISIVLLTFLLFAFMLKLKSVNMARFTLTSTLSLLFVIMAIAFSLMQPFVERMLSVSTDLLNSGHNSTSNYRRELIEDRIRIIKRNNPWIGIGFVHERYAYNDYGPFIGNQAPGELPTIGCADIAWGNIIYQTGIIGVVSFLLYIVALLAFIVKQLSRYQMDLLFLQMASCFELLRNIFLMFIGSSYTYQTHNIALFLGVSAYLHIVHSRHVRLSS